MIPASTRSLAEIPEIPQICPICGKPITGSSAMYVPWPAWSADNRAPADFRPHEIRLKPRAP